MSSAARFLLEFEATGDQEVVSKIKAVGEAGKQTATDLESLRGIQDPFEPIATGADAAVAPIEGVGTAAEEAVIPITDMGTATDETVSILSGAGTTAEEFGSAMEGVGTAADTAVTPLTGVGTAASESLSIFSGAGTAVGDFSANLDAVGGAADAATGGLTPANTMMGNFAESTSGAGESASSAAGNVGQFAGSITAMGGIIGTTIGAIFRMQDAQLRLDKANLRAARATETARIAEQAFFDLLAKAPSNREAIAAATDTYNTAQERLTALQEAGITTGAEYEAAQAAVATATAELKAAFVEGGGSAADFDKKLNKMNITQEAAAIAAQAAAKALREQQQGLIEMGFNITSIIGTMAQFISGSKNMIDQSKKIGSAFGGLAGGIGGLISKLPTLSGMLGEIGPIGIAIYDAFVLAGAGVKLFEGITAHAGGEAEKAAVKYKEAFDFAKIFQAVGPNVQVVSDILKRFGVNVDDSMKKSIEGFLGVSKETKKTKDSVVDLGNGYSIVNNVLRKTVDVQKEAAATQTNIGTTAADAEKNITDLGAGIAEQNINSAAATAGNEKYLQTLQQLEQSSGAAEQEISNLGAGMFDLTARYQAASTEAANNAAANNQAAEVILKMIDNVNNAQEAISEVNLAYAESKDKLADLNTVLNDAGAHHNAVATAVNETAAALMEESIQLEAAIQSADSVSQAQMRLANAQKQGTLEIKEYINGLDEAQAGEQAMVAELQRSGAAWSDIPPFVERNIDTLKLFGIAAKRGGEAAREAADMAAKAWQDATSEMGSEIQGLADIFMEGGEKMGEATDKWFEDIEGKIGRSLTGAEAEAVKGIAHMIEGTDQAINNWQLAQLLTGKVDAGADALASSFESMADSVGGKLSEVFAKAAEIIRADPSMAAAVNDVMSEIGTTAPQLLLDKLNKLPGAMGQIGTQGGTNLTQGIIGGVQQGAGAVEQELAGIQDQFVTNAANKPIVIPADISPAVQKITELENILVSVQAAPIRIGADLSEAIQKVTDFENVLVSTAASPIKITANLDEAIQAVTDFENTIVSVGLAPIPITADNSVALQQINVVKTNLDNLKQSRIPPIAVNNAQAISQIKVVQTQLNAIKQTRIPTVRVNNAQAISQIKVVQTQLNNIKQTRIPTVRVNNSQALSQINRVKSALNSLKNITRTITYRYRTVGSPPRGAQSGMHERLQEDTLISAHKGERVDINPSGGPAIEKPGPTHTIYGGGGGRGRGGGEIVIPVTLMLDNKVLIRTVRRGLVEEVSGTM